MLRNELTTEPFLRWAGGKSWLVHTIKDILGCLEYKNYYEPFMGGAVIFFSIGIHKHAYLSDLNKELVDCYIEVRDHPNEVISRLDEMPNTEEDYYRIRNESPADKVTQAARFIYLNQTSYNGLYRVNKEGKYNVPYGFRKRRYDSDRLLQASKKLQKVKICCEDFEKRKYQVKAKDLVFLDPPYTVSHNKNGFIEYNQSLFSLKDQYRLKKFIDFIANKGAYYILTNAAHETIFEIFDRGDRILKLERNCLIGGKNAKRLKVSEYVFTNIPERG